MSGTITSQRLAGLVSLTIDGQAWDVAADFAYNPSTVKRETIKGQSRVEGYSEMPEAGYISATLRDRGNTTVATFNAMTNSTIVAQLANGKTIMGSAMWCVESEEVRTQEATFAVRWDGDVVELPVG